MARQVGQRSADYSTPRPVPPSGKVTKRTDPFSPWQLLVEETRLEKGLSWRELAKQSRISHTVLFNWTHSVVGIPSKSLYKLTVNKRLSRALNLEEDILLAAWDRSAIISASSFNRPILDLIELIKGSPQKTYTQAQVLRLAHLALK